jgi:hypothetical protein
LAKRVADLLRNNSPNLSYKESSWRTLNEHEHVDKQIFKILEGAEVCEKSRRFIEEQFAKIRLQKNY